MREDAASRSWSEVAFSVVSCLRLKMDWAGGTELLLQAVKSGQACPGLAQATRLIVTRVEFSVELLQRTLQCS